MTCGHSGATAVIQLCLAKRFCFVALQNLWLSNVHMSTKQLLIAHSGRPHVLGFKTVLLYFLGTN